MDMAKSGKTFMDIQRNKPEFRDPDQLSVFFPLFSGPYEPIWHC